MPTSSLQYQSATIAVRTGLNCDSQHHSVITPITLSSCYRYQALHQPNQFDYARKNNPTRSVVEQALAQLEGGCAAILTNCGMSAIHLLAITLLQPNDTVIVPHDCYGGSYRLFNSLSQKGYFQVQFVDQADEQALQQALALAPKLVLIESPSNPLLRIVDIAKICQLAHQVGAVVAVDNTFMTPILQQPLKLGADIVLHSCTKYLNGHSDLLAGALIFQSAALAEQFNWWANNLGTVNSAFDSYLLSRGLRTLAARIQLQQQTALTIVNFLQQHPKVARVYHPSLPNHCGHQLAKKQQAGFGAMLSFELQPSVDIVLFINQLQIFTLAQSLGGVESLICHPASMTHAGMSAQARQQAGISEQLLRLSVGLEAAGDLIADLEQALAAL